MFHKFSLYSALWACMLSTGYPLNLTLTDYHDPAANHILDAEVVGSVRFVSGMVQGIEFYDKSNPEDFFLYGINGFDTVNPSWYYVDVTYLDSSLNNFQNNLELVASFARTGDSGTSGSSGRTSSSG